MQIDGLNELPKEKRPPEAMIWDGTIEEIESWIDKVLGNKQETTLKLEIPEAEIEG